ncbi:unnamed protein product [Triticum turgidum subsp. durum]|uniref:Esterase n=1 Tax=Triticum turgidum subsp. durum TaxID=4567 RepID=A0A9R1BVF4_TRITD|nr:unnamed protein product [Triticum turgidum subsp. durum]
MASSPLLVALVMVSACFLAVSGQKFNAIYSFGDSMSDTGNLCVNGPPAGLTLTQPPYGETFFGRATCRCSDGRLVVDFLAEKFGLPLLKPSKQGGANFKQGANMAIIGATAMGSSFFQSLGVGDKIWNNGPLDSQIQWFQNLLPSVCGSSCKTYLSKSLFVLGELGGNDYNAQLFGGYTPEQAAGQSPTIVDAIGAGAEKLIGLGAMYVVIPGVLPVGCFPIYLTLYQTSNAGDYDQYGCLKRFNALSARHNSLLQSKVSSLQSKYPYAKIMYADFYSHVFDMVKSPTSYGRVQHEPEGVLRRRRRQVQLPERRQVRHVRRVGVRQPVVVAELGRDPPDGGGLQEDCRRLGQRALLPPGHPLLEARASSR